MSHVVKKQSNKQKEKLAHKKASEIPLKSKLTGPISNLSVLRRSLLFSEISMISYLSIEQCNIAAGRLGFTDGKFFNSEGAQAYNFWNEWDSVVVFRGTEADDWNDIKADVNAITAIAETVGKVHRGFKEEVDHLWPYLEEVLKDNKLPLWFCGHSLGGAMARIAAGRCLISHIRSEPEELYTFGSPRVGCKRYVNHVQMKHFRWVNNNDIVTRVPPTLLGYRHSGIEMYMNRFGKLKDISGWRRSSDRLQGFLKELTKFRIDQLGDHSCVDYIENIFDVVRAAEEQNPLPEYAQVPTPSQQETPEPEEKSETASVGNVTNAEGEAGESEKTSVA